MKINKTYLTIFFILVLACFLRLYHYSDRISVSTDQGRDAIVALEAIRLHKLPLLGPPSSAWGFNFGPLYYYFIILFSLVIPGSLGPWVGFTLLSIASIWLLSRIDKVGIYLALIATISLGEINNSLNLLNTALVYFASVLSFYSLHKVLTTHSKIFSILLGFSIALAINYHMQALSLLAFIPLSIIFIKTDIKKRIILLLSEVLGFITGFLPLLYFESLHNFAWVKSILDYTLHGQNKFYTPVRWLTEFTQVWPSIFGNTIFGDPKYGYFLMALIVIALIISFIKKIKTTSLFFCIAITFIIEILSVRYYKGPRSPEYFIIAIPFVIFFVSWAIYIFSKLNKFICWILITLMIIISFPNMKALINTHSQAPKIFGLYNQTVNKYQGRVNFYTFNYSDEGGRFLYYLLMKNNRISQDATDSIAICDLRDSEGKIIEYCPKEGRELKVDRFIIYKYADLKKMEIDQYQVASVSAEILYKRLYNNYELIKY